ncbi:SHOCT domain-containing protein [Cellulomonas sp. ES6]|uniref:SHOCT domain-containing protein n=1 Tax=Cellulomonas sp. ES6 TaxID=3039384 RepID=UPI0024B73240|nr:SHOCT domain-containing protein [Cellulomonas sp. ES6]WHP19322.1 SHOCT domain-containing protein [Cellulomonas sp. ES6]
MSSPVTAPPAASAPPAPGRGALVLLLIALGAGALTWWLLWLGAHDATLVRWECAAAQCATDDLAGAAFPLAVFAAGVLVTTLAPLARRATPGLVVALAAGALVTGWSGAVRDGLSPLERVRVPLVVAGALLVAGLVAAVLGGVRSARTSGVGPRLLGLTGTWARVRDYETVDRTRCRATVHYADARGTRYAVRTEVPREAFRHAPRAYYDPLRPGDPSRLRVAVPPQPLGAAGRRARDEAVRALLPLPDDDLPGGAPATASTRRGARPGAPGTSGSSAAGTGSVSGAGMSGTSGSSDASPGDAAALVHELERLHALHASGALTDGEYAAGKARVLGDRGGA